MSKPSFATIKGLVGANLGITAVGYKVLTTGYHVHPSTMTALKRRGWVTRNNGYYIPTYEGAAIIRRMNVILNSINAYLGIDLSLSDAFFEYGPKNFYLAHETYNVLMRRSNNGRDL